MKINFLSVQQNVSEIANRQTYTMDVLYELMAAYGRAAASITKLRSGNLNLSEDKKTTVLQRGVVYFKVVTNFGSLPAEIEKLEQDPLTQRYNPRFLIATDLKTFAAKDTKKGNTLEIAWQNIDRNVDFFYGWTGDEVADEKTEAVADRRAADKMKDLYQELEKVNLDKFKNKSIDFRHHLNVFFTRLLFCFFAEDTRVFSKEDTYIFTDSIKNFTQPDGSDLDQFLGTLFESLDEEDKSKYTSPFSKFPYVNGKIFSKNFGIEIPKFNAQARKLILDCGALSWAEINPDIFGSMFQSIVDEEHRSTHGMHYTSVPNIMKTIEPLFLDELRDEFDKHYDNPKQLQKLHERISKIKVFDPACGSGNFLIIAYKELRKLEHAIIDKLFDKDYERTALAGKLKSKIELDNFYGIEIDDFACEVAVLSLYLAKHQMNIEFEKQFGQEIKLIPLKDKANIRHGNATRVDWQEVCPNKPIKRSFSDNHQQQLIATALSNQQAIEGEDWEEIYIIGNPPYLGQRNQKDEHKADLKHVFGESDGKYKKMDYVCCWFYLGAMYISSTPTKLAFISTNSISQGVQIEQLWPRIFSKNVEISYAFRPFKWVNSARDVAGVYCVVVSLQSSGFPKSSKYIYESGFVSKATNVNPYLIDAKNIILNKINSPIAFKKKMVGGCQPREGGYLMLSQQEKDKIVQTDPLAQKFILPMIGSVEFLEDKKRWCIWIEDKDLSEALAVKEINTRIQRVKEKRENGNSVERTFARVPHKFVTTKRPKQTQILIPTITTSSREYIPIGYANRDVIVNSRMYCLFDAELYYFAILSSKTHNIWVQTTSGRLGNAINYSSNLCYNSFPIKELTETNKSELTDSAKNILFVRENHIEKTLAEMYDPDKMPNDLKEAHHQNDLLVDRLYRQKPYANDEERLADLFKLYEEMVAKEKE
jgi:hypothetical protein